MAAVTFAALIDARRRQARADAAGPTSRVNERPRFHD
jgi:hypothetical protein